MGPAIAYSNQLDLPLCLPQLNVPPAISAIIPGLFEFRQFPAVSIPISAIRDDRWQFGQWDPPN